jgi:CarD family transcriptional regulator
LKFKVGDAVVVPGCGVGILSAIEQMAVGGLPPLDVYRIELNGEEGTTWIPVNAANPDRLRPVMDSERVEPTWEALTSQEVPDKLPNWNRRQRRYNEHLLSGDPGDLALVAGELSLVQARKPLSYGERRLYDKARRLLVEEIAAVTRQGVEAVEARFDATLAAS